MSIRVLSGDDVKKVVLTFTHEELIDMMASLFLLLASGEGFVMPDRLSIDTGSLTALLMPSMVNAAGTSIKIVSVPHEGGRGLPASTLVLDQVTGAVKGLVNARNLTALRTAAGSALATRYLANQASTCLVAFGAGAQIEEHINLLIPTIPTISRCIVVNHSKNDRLEGLISRVSARHANITFESVVTLGKSSSNLEAAVRSADIICTATSSTVPLFSSAWVKPGTHVNMVGSYKPTMHEVDTDLVRRANKIVVDSRKACLAEAGELINAKLTADDLIELGHLHQVQEDKGPGEEKDVMVSGKDITIFKSVGVGAQDVVITCAVLERAEKMGLGTVIRDYDSPHL